MEPPGNPKYLYFVGKGGVGKSTCASSTAMALAEQKKKTLIVSLDPAHNLSDIFETPLDDSPKLIKENLFAMEIDIEKRMESYLKKTIQMMKNLYTYLNVVNLEGLFDTLRYSPGMEEYAVLLALEDVFDNYREMDFIIFDTPPTALTLRIFALPELTGMWTEKLSNLRKKILDRRGSLKHILGDKMPGGDLPTSVSTDSVFKELTIYKEKLKKIKSRFSSEKDTFMFLLLNPDKLSFAEGNRIAEAFRKFRLPLSMVIINKNSADNKKLDNGFMDNFLDDLKKSFKGMKTMELPFKAEALSREDMLNFGEEVIKNL